MDPGEKSVPYQLEGLIVTAFVAARDRRKPDWRRMTVAVLKNRLIQLSHREFSERRHGATSIRELLTRYPTLVRVDGDVVELVTSIPEGTDAAPAARTRIRADLWRSIIDFAGGKKFAWDANEGRAREATAGETHILPTLTREEFAQWRAEFAATHPTEGLVQWCEQSLGTKELPAPLRREWSLLVASRVTRRLTDWFAAESLPAPSLTENAADTRAKDGSVERLRDVVAACVAVMTREELSAVALPPAAVLRAKLGGHL